MLGGAIANGINAVIDATPIAQTENFESRNGINPPPARVALVSILTVAVILGALLFFGKYLWNNVLVNVLTIAKPIKSVWQLLGLAILLALLNPGSCTCA